MPTLVTRKRNLKHSLSARLIARLGNAMLAALELPDAELSVLLTDDDGIHELNRQHRQKDKPTDVLAFAMDESVPDPAGILGDVVISLDTAERQARSRRRPLIEEVRFLLAHGVLHLVGYDHAEAAEKREMVGMTRKLVRLATLPGPSNRRPRPRSVALDLWDGTRAILPEVSDRPSLSATLEKVAHARAIPVRGGHGLDELPDSGEFAEGDDEAAS